MLTHCPPLATRTLHQRRSLLALPNSTDIQQPPSCDERIKYVASVLLGESLSEFVWPRWLRYSEEVSNPGFAGLRIVPSGFFGVGYGSARSLPLMPLGCVEGVPLLFGRPQIWREGDSLVVEADILASAYFLLTRYEEWVRRDIRDEHGRFPGRESLPYRADFIHRPVVNEYSVLLRKWACHVGVRLHQPRRQFSVLLTHDVDRIRTTHRFVNLARTFRNGPRRPGFWRSVTYQTLAALHLVSDPAQNIREVIQLEQPLTRGERASRCRSVYFFMARDGRSSRLNYDIRHPRVREIFRDVLQSKSTIGLHASYEAGQRPETIAAERQRLEEAARMPIAGNRHHFLAWREPQDGHALAAAGIRWDSTMGYADVAGFRLGVCHPVPLFDPSQRRLIGIMEHPLIVMDCTLSSPSYMKLTEDLAYDRVCELADVTCRHRGEFVILWHNHVLAKTDVSYHKRLYGRVLDYLARLV